MNQPRVLCLGEILFDCLADRVGASVGEIASWTRFPGGAPANVACALVKLGIPAAFIGCVGVDREGDELIQLCQDLGVNGEGIQRHSTAPTRQVYVLRNEEGDRSFAGFGTQPPDAFADAFLDGSKLPVHLFKTAEYLVLGTLELAYPQTKAAIFRALELARANRVKVILDLNWRSMFWTNPQTALEIIPSLFPSLDFLKCAKEEADLFFQTQDLQAIARHFQTITGIIITDGAGPIRYLISGHEGEINPFKITVIDTTGAGDSFVAGLIKQLLQINDLDNPDLVQQMIVYAAAVGGLTTTKLGAINAQPTAAQVALFLNERSPFFGKNG